MNAAPSGDGIGSPKTAETDFDLGGFRVQPALNRLSRGDESQRLEPKVMDVLLQLARRGGQVVSKEELASTVWAGVFITDSVVTRAIAELRRAFDDDARAPRFIETIAKRGYRLLPAVVIAGPAAETARRPSSFSPGQWVRGERFFGREAQIAEILDGPRNGLWVLGTRAIGKTSLLKELERRCLEDPGARYFPLFLDLQGCGDLAGLTVELDAVLAEAGARLEELGVDADADGEEFFRRLGRLRRGLRERGRTLLLLWDEAEELLRLDAADPSVLPKLRRALQSQEGVRTVIASGPRLWQLGERLDDTSPFLHGFAPPIPLPPLDSGAARALLEAGNGEPLPDPVLRALVAESGGHPSLLQLLGARFASLGDLEQAKAAVAADRTVHLHFTVDLDLVSASDREALGRLARGEADPSDPALLALVQLGMVRSRPAGGFELANPLLRRFLLERPAG